MSTQKSRRGRALSAAALIGVAVAISPLSPAEAASFPVTTTGDSVDSNVGDGICADVNLLCSLRAAVMESEATAGADTIVLPAANFSLTIGPAGTADAATGDLDITGDLTIQSTGAAINALAIGDRVFDVGAGASLTLVDVVLFNGAPPSGENGGLIRNLGRTELIDTSLTDGTVTGATSSGGGIFNAGTLTMTGSQVLNSSAERAGGGIEAVEGATTTVVDSEISLNRTGPTPGNGGGFHQTGAGTSTFTDSRLSLNTAANEGGGLWNSATGSMEVANTEVIENEVDGTGPGGMTFVDPDFEGGGGIFNDGTSAGGGSGGTLIVRQSTILLNTVDVEPDQAGSGGGILNVFGDVTIDDTLIERNTADRAGGGVESVGGTVFISDTNIEANAVDPNPGNGGGVHLTGAAALTLDTVAFLANLAVEGGGLWASAASTVGVNGSSFTSNVAAGEAADQGGGGIYAETDGAGDGAEITVTASTFEANAAVGTAGSGGGIFLNDGSLDVSGTTFEQNSARRAGGAIEALGGTTTVTDVDFDLNEAGPAPGNGGAVHLTGAGTVAITRGSATGNVADNEGGAFWNSATGTMTLTDVTIAENVASGEDFTSPNFEGGGGVFNDGVAAAGEDPASGGTLTIVGGSIVGNAANQGAGSGGGILNVFGTLSVQGTLIQANDAARAGAGIESNGGTVTLTGVTIAMNETGANPGNGGGLHLTGAGTVAVNGSTVSGNVAANEGGGLWNSATGTMTVDRSRIFDNVAQGVAEGSGGGGLYNDGGTLDVSTSTVTGNVAAGLGGGVLDVNDGDTTLLHVTVTENQAPDGAGVGVLGNTVTATGSIIAGNATDDCDGAVASGGGNVTGDCGLDGAGDETGVDDPALTTDFVPEASSAAIDNAADGTCPATDLDGAARPTDGDGDGAADCDSGALEAAAVEQQVTTTSTTSTSTTSTTIGSGSGSTTTVAVGAGGASRGLPRTGGDVGLVGAALQLVGAGAVAAGLAVIVSRRPRGAHARR
jgi:predicted outer membrane repeat protein